MQVAEYHSYQNFPELFDSRLPNLSQNSFKFFPELDAPTDGIDNTGTNKLSEDTIQVMCEQDSRWVEVKNCCGYIRRFATEASHTEVTKENYCDLYNMAVCLLKFVDSLDPDNLQNGELESSKIGPVQPLTEIELLQARKSFDYYYNRGSLDHSFLPKYTAEVPSTATFYNQTLTASLLDCMSMLPSTYQQQVQCSASKTETSSKHKKLRSYSASFDNMQHLSQQNQSQPRLKISKKRRRRTVHSSRAHLNCHMCGVSETPEWRRGPAGDHTLCNACGLRYATLLKKPRKEGQGK